MKSMDLMLGLTVVVIVATAGVGMYQQRRASTPGLQAPSELTGLDPEGVDPGTPTGTIQDDTRENEIVGRGGSVERKDQEVHDFLERSRRINEELENEFESKRRQVEKRSSVDQSPETPNTTTQQNGRQATGPKVSGESTASIRRRRAKCRADLDRAEAVRKRLQAQFDQGVASVATIDTRMPGSGYRVDVSGATVSCRQALRDKRPNPDAAATCETIQKQLALTEVAFKRALECLRR